MGVWDGFSITSYGLISMKHIYFLPKGAVKKLLRQICEDTGAELKEIHLDFPITGEEQVNKKQQIA